MLKYTTLITKRMIPSHIDTIAPHIILSRSTLDKSASNTNLTAPLTCKIAPLVDKMPPLTCKMASGTRKILPHDVKMLPRTRKLVPLTCKMLPHGRKMVPLIGKMFPQGRKMVPHNVKIHSQDILIGFPIAPVPSLLSTFAARQASIASQGQQKSLSARPALTHEMRTFAHLI